MDPNGSSSTVDIAIPPKPPVVFESLPAAPRKRKGRGLIAAAAAAVILIGGIGIGVAATGHDEPATPAPYDVPGGHLEPGQEPVQPIEPAVPTVGEVAGQAATLLRGVSPELNAALRSFKAYDMDGAANHLDNVGDIYDQVSALWLPVDGDMASYLGNAADEEYKAADALRNYRIGASTKHMKNATNWIRLSTLHTKSLTAEVTG